MTRKRILFVIGAVAVGLAGLAMFAGIFRRGEALHGSGTVAHLWTDGLVLLGMGTGLILLAAKRFQKKVITA